jgi:hypothetical protein
MSELHTHTRPRAFHQKLEAISECLRQPRATSPASTLRARARATRGGRLPPSHVSFFVGSEEPAGGIRSRPLLQALQRRLAGAGALRPVLSDPRDPPRLGTASRRGVGGIGRRGLTQPLPERAVARIVRQRSGGESGARLHAEETHHKQGSAYRGNIAQAGPTFSAPPAGCVRTALPSAARGPAGSGGTPVLNSSR